ncbi:MAG: histidine phosphotransferase family protein [Pseudomonadota bacterium]
MNQGDHPSDLELAALLASKICHDVVGPVGAFGNGLEMLATEDNQQAQAYAMDMLQNVSTQATARLEFARFAFGAAGSAGAQIDLAMAQKLTENYIGDGKHTLTWAGPAGHMDKDYVKLLLNLVSSGISALPRGGTLGLTINGTLEKPQFVLRCAGQAARPPQHLTEFIIGKEPPALHAMTIQAYYTWRLAAHARMRIEILKDGEDIVLQATAT